MKIVEMIPLWQTCHDNIDLEVATERGVVVSNSGSAGAT